VSPGLPLKKGGEIKMENKEIEITLILLNGQKISVSIPDDIWEESVWPEIKDNFANQGLWNCGNWNQVAAIFMKERLSYIDFQKVVGVIF
jgi:hypothetical protein